MLYMYVFRIFNIQIVHLSLLPIVFIVNKMAQHGEGCLGLVSRNHVSSTIDMNIP